MRNFKFRAYDTKENKMRMYGDEFYNTPFNDSEGCFPDEIFEITNKNYGWEWMQFTGVTDKNGKEIYEGDIIQVGDDKKFITECKFENGRFKFIQPIIGTDVRLTRELDEIDFATIIGNIYENPKLIE